MLRFHWTLSIIHLTGFWWSARPFAPCTTSRSGWDIRNGIAQDKLFCSLVLGLCVYAPVIIPHPAHEVCGGEVTTLMWTSLQWFKDKRLFCLRVTRPCYS